MRRVLVMTALALAVMTLSAAGHAYTGVQLKIQADYPDGGGFVPVTVGWIDNITTNGKDSGWDEGFSLVGPLPGQAVVSIDNPVIASGPVISDYRYGSSALNIWHLNLNMPVPFDDPMPGEPTGPMAFSCGIRAWFVTGFPLSVGSPTAIYILDGNYGPTDWWVGTWSGWVWRARMGVTANGITTWNYVSRTDAFNVPAGGSHPLTIVAVNGPEPGSPLALLTGLAGCAGFYIRRRR